MKLYVKNTLQGLTPLYPADYDEKKKLKIGKEYEVEIRHPRNYMFHKKYFALLNIGWQNTEVNMPFDTYRRWVTMRAGYYDIYETPKGKLYEAQSISFGNMDQIKFEEVYSRVLDVIISDLGITAEDVENEIMSFM